MRTLRALISASALAALVCAAGPSCKSAEDPKPEITGEIKIEGPPAKELCEAYLKIQTTLADDKLDDLPQLSARVVAATGLLGGEDVGLDRVLAGAGRTAAEDISTARLGFKKMSDGMIAYLQAHPEHREGLEIIHCPMAFNNQGADWVQRKGDILNPYHGKMMLHCGDHVPWPETPKAAPPPAG
ncbi:MAG: DUF3347 domain-containing protein [Myxococcales bacterium]|nr:DUF3347 domain-containing protein [Myxococcales bacterium]